RELSQAVLFARKQDETHVGLAKFTQGTELVPAMMRRHGGVVATVKQYGRRRHLVKVVERRVLTIELRVLDRRFAEVVVGKAHAEFTDAPVGGPLGASRAGAGGLIVPA